MQHSSCGYRNPRNTSMSPGKVYAEEKNVKDREKEGKAKEGNVSKDI